MNIQVFQIFFDETSRQQLDLGFIPYDNQKPIIPELYEFSVIYHWLKSNVLDEKTYYGFVSPSFYNKTAIASSNLYGFIGKSHDCYDAYYFTAGWDQLAFHQNVFFQGEFFHQGFYSVAKEFYHSYGGDPDILNSYASTFGNSVFSNYVVANRAYWKKWMVLADHFMEMYLSKNIVSMYDHATYGKNGTTHAVFLQERLHSFLMMDHPELRVLPYDTTIEGPVLTSIFVDTHLNRKLLRACEALKSQYEIHGDLDAINLYRQIQAKVILAL